MNAERFYAIFFVNISLVGKKMWLCHTLSILNNPPAMVGLQTGSALFLCFFFSRSGTACQLNCKFQSNPPTLTPPLSLKWYSSVVSSITSITGQTTVVGFLAMRSSNGSNQPTVHSQCESRYVSTGAVAYLAPKRRALISPSRFLALITLTLPNLFM